MDNECLGKEEEKRNRKGERKEKESPGDEKEERNSSCVQTLGSLLSPQ